MCARCFLILVFIERMSEYCIVKLVFVVVYNWGSTSFPCVLHFRNVPDMFGYTEESSGVIQADSDMNSMAFVHCEEPPLCRISVCSCLRPSWWRDPSNRQTPTPKSLPGVARQGSEHLVCDGE